MPVVDWCRTDLEWELPNGARALRFDQVRFAAFDLFILERPGAEAEYSEAEAEKWDIKSVIALLYPRLSQIDKKTKG